MPPKRTRYFWQKKKKKTVPPSLFLIGGVVISVLLLAFVLQQTMPRRESVGETLPPPDFAALLPEGSVVSGAPLELPDVPQSAYVVSFMSTAGDSSLGLVVWDKRANKYKLTSMLGLAVGDFRLLGAAALTAESLGRGAPTAILARGPSGAYADGIFVVVRQGDSLSFVARKEPNGTAGIAYFLSGSSVRNGEELSFGDVDGDGDKEALQASTRTDENGKSTETLAVYVWQDGYFSYNKDLSWALTMSKRVFPEPEAPPDAVM